MRRKPLLGIGALLAALLLSGALATQAEGSVNGSDYNIYILILGIIEDPDPIPSITYQQLSDGSEGSLDDREVVRRNDGRPDVAIDPATGWPVVAWSTGADSDYDIAFAEWDGDYWNGIDFLTSTSQQELDPRAYIDSFRKTYVIWWTPGAPDKIFLTSRAAGEVHWKGQTQIANDGRRPSLTIHDGSMVLAFERDLATGGQEVVVAFLTEDGSITTESIATTSRTDRLDAVVHSSEGQLWVDWKDSETDFAYSVLEPSGWSEPATLPWPDRSWTGEEAMRRAIKAEVLSP